MAHSDTDDDAIDENELFDEDVDVDGDADGDAEGDIDEELLDAINEVDEATEEGDESISTGSDDSDNEDEEDSEHVQAMAMDVDQPPAPQNIPSPTMHASQPAQDTFTTSSTVSVPPSLPSPPRVRKHSLSPAGKRRKALMFPFGSSTYRACVVEAVCALPHPVPIHSLASSACMSHLLTGADDGYVRDYDIFTAVNGKNFLTAPQRHHAGVVEGILKAGQFRFWWENPSPSDPSSSPQEEDLALAPVYSLAMQSDALWALAGSDNGTINLFTVRHNPGRLCHTMQGHRGPISALSLGYNEKAVYSAGWDGDAIHWDLNTGQRTRTMTAHGAQLTAIAVRPMNFFKSGTVSNDATDGTSQTFDDVGRPPPKSATQAQDADGAGSDDGSFDDLFDEPDENAQKASFTTSLPSSSQIAKPGLGTVAAPKNAPPLLDSYSYSSFSPDILMTAAIDGQIVLWDKRASMSGTGVGRLWMGEKTPPWCISACWSPDGGRIYAGRRNGAIDAYDVRQFGRSGPSDTPRLLKTLRNPASSGVVSCVVAFPDNKHIACASIDNLRLWNVDAVDTDQRKPKSGAQFKIIPGHHGGHISNLLVDPGCRFLVSASSNRGWHGESTKTVFVHDIKHVQ